jgi:hypothetical protein
MENQVIMIDDLPKTPRKKNKRDYYISLPNHDFVNLNYRSNICLILIKFISLGFILSV